MIDVDAGLVERLLLELARDGAYGETGVWRTVYSPEWVAAQDRVAVWMGEAGMDVRRDAVGSVWGTLAGSEGGPVIATGSHIDSQTPGGRYDGALGVIAGLVALRTLREQFGSPRRTLEAVSLCEEEASRFHATNFWGSRAIVGGISPEETERIRDREGVSIGEAMRAVGLDPERIPEARRDDLDTWIELHIEQGPILEEEGLPVGVVDAITAIRHYVVELRGRSDHAGARPMKGRLDPMAGFAEIVTAVIGVALENGPPAVTTVGPGGRAAEPALGRARPGDLHARLTPSRPADGGRPARAAGAADARDRRAAGPADLLDEAARPPGVPVRSDDRRGAGAGRRPSRESPSAGCTAAPVTTRRTSRRSRRRRWCSPAARTGAATRPRSSRPSRTAVAAISVLAAALHQLAY